MHVKLYLLFVLYAAIAPIEIALSETLNTTYCDNKYNYAAELVDAGIGEYDTLYSGGLHHHRLDDIRGTIELYRFWSGLPDAKLRDFGYWPDRYYDFPGDRFRNHDYGNIDDIWRDAKWVLKGKNLKEEPEGFWASWGLDAITSVGPAVDWWHHPGDFQNLTQWQEWVAQTSKNEPGLDWLQTVLAASNAPWANHAHLSSSISDDLKAAYRRLSQTAWQKFLSNGELIWFVAAAITNPDPYLTTPMDERLVQLGNRVANCTASPKEFATYAVSIAVRARMRGRGYSWRSGPLPDDIVGGGLPTTVQRTIAVDHLYGAMFKSWHSYTRRNAYLTREELANFRNFAPEDVVWQQMVDFASLYSAATVEEIPLSENAHVRRAYNALPTDDLLSLGQRAKDDSLIIAAFARYIALGEWQNAALLLNDIKSALPDHAANIEDIFALKERLPVRLSLIAAHTPYISTIIGGGYTRADFGLSIWNRNLGIDGYNTIGFARKSNLPRDYVTQDFLLRDIEVWLRLPKKASAFYSMRGTTIGWLERGFRRDTYAEILYKPIIDSSPFYRLIAIDELRRLAGDERLLHSIANILIKWAAQSTDSWFKRTFVSQDVQSKALARLIHLCRFETCGSYNNKPAQQRAFMILQGRMARTEAARTTRYWWPSPKPSFYSAD